MPRQRVSISFKRLSALDKDWSLSIEKELMKIDRPHSLVEDSSAANGGPEGVREALSNASFADDLIQDGMWID
jgi:hypothetical protein